MAAPLAGHQRGEDHRLGQPVADRACVHTTFMCLPRFISTSARDCGDQRRSSRSSFKEKQHAAPRRSGPGFGELHRLFDQFADETRAHLYLVAERAVAPSGGG
jgi:hypothetical protein